MAITSLRIGNFRNLAAIELDPCVSGLNIICGDNGSGKTSILEAIHYLGLGRSFRTSTAAPLINHTAEKFSIFTQLVSSSARQVSLGVDRDNKGTTRLRLDEQDIASITEMASLLPIRVINSQSHHIFESGPTYRRKFLDWGLFYHTAGFLLCWRQFERALRQRNAVLRDKRSKRELDAWSEELANYGQQLHQMRLEYLTVLTPFLIATTHELLGRADLEIEYRCGWNEAQDYASVLMELNPSEFRLGHTQYGPHRADFDIKMDGIAAKHFLSRGQQKLLICAMIIAQGMVLAELEKPSLIYLIDDLPSELDLHSRSKLISLLSKQKSQIYITSIEKDIICDLIDKSNVPLKVFHVKHGSLFSAA